MKYVKTLLAVAAALFISAPTAMARSNFELELNFGPPAPIYEAVPPPRVGLFWAADGTSNAGTGNADST